MAEVAPARRPVLLVHGAFRGGWAWTRVRSALLDAGLDVYAPSLPGCGERYGDTEVQSLSVWTDALEELVVAEDLLDLVLVGHSQGALVTSALASRIPERIGALIHLDGALADAGERAVDLGGGTLHVLPTRDVWVPFSPVDESPVCSAELASWINDRLTPTPVGPSLDVVPTIPVSVDQYFYFADGTPEGYPSALSRRRRDDRNQSYVLLQGEHDLPLLAPEVTVEAILDVVLRDASVGRVGPEGTHLETNGG